MTAISSASAPLISIVVPVYGAERQLPQCLDSLLRQSYSAIEIILVEDGSPDNCAEVCDHYAAIDPRIRVHHQANAGASAARNKGIELAKGEYLCFVDADDDVEDNYISAFVEGIGPEVDLVFQGIHEIQGEKDARRIPKRKLYLPTELTDGIADLNKEAMFLFGYVCTKLYRLDIIRTHHLAFRRDISLSEDRIFALTYMRHIRCMQTVSNCAYNYRMVATGLTLRRRSYEELKIAADANFQAAQELLQVCPSSEFERDTKLTYINSGFDYLAALFINAAPLTLRIAALRTFYNTAGAWLPLHHPDTKDAEIMHLALRCPAFAGVCILQLYWKLKRWKHRIGG